MHPASTVRQRRAGDVNRRGRPMRSHRSDVGDDLDRFSKRTVAPGCQVRRHLNDTAGISEHR